MTSQQQSQDQTRTIRRSSSAPDLSELDQQQVEVSRHKQHRRSSAPPSTRRISFGTIQVRSYEVVRGHPDIEMAHPLSLGWDYTDAATTCSSENMEPTITVDDYEQARRTSRARSARELRTNSEERRSILQASARRKQTKDRPQPSSWLAVSTTSSKSGIGKYVACFWELRSLATYAYCTDY